MRDDALAKVGPKGPSYTFFQPATTPNLKPFGEGCTTDTECCGGLCKGGSCACAPTSPSCNNLMVSKVNPAETASASPSEIGSGNCSQDMPAAAGGHIWRRLFGLMTVPLYTTTPNPDGALNLGPDGMPAQNGMAEYEFEVNIPVSATKGTPGA